MNTKALLGTSAVVLGVSGIAGSFLPHELLEAMSVRPDAASALVVQVLAAGWFGFAMVNWMARGSLIGGIYNRPVAVGNLAHFLIGGLAAAKAVLGGQRNTAVMILAAVYVVFAIAFAMLLFRSPVRNAD